MQIRVVTTLFYLVVLICGAIGCSDAYNVNAPVYPVAYSDAQVASQQMAGRGILKRLSSAMAAGAHSFTFPPGVYRLPATNVDHSKYVNDDGSLNFGNVHSFTLNLRGVEIILGNGSTFLAPDDGPDITILGPAVFDAETLRLTQGIVVARDESSGLTTIKIMPGYAVHYAAEGQIDAFSSQGVYLQNPSWASYSGYKVLDEAAGIVQLKAASKGLYLPGNLVALRNGGPVFLSAGGQGAHNLTLRDLEIDTGVGFAWGHGTGNWSFDNVRCIRRPGTNRLLGGGGCQTWNSAGDVTFNGCEFSNTTDDLIDYSGGGLFVCERQDAPRTIVTWGGSFSPGDKLNFYTHDSFQPDATAKVVTVTAFTDPAIEADGHRLIKDVLKARDQGDQILRRVTLDQDISVSAADFIENGTANRPDHFTVRNCYFHDSAVRVMVQGFQHGLFENNRFECISGGLALTCDAWWFEGPTVQDVVVRNNIFKATTFRNGWGTGPAALIIGPSWGGGHTDPRLQCATHGAVVTGNTFLGSSAGAIQISNTDHVTVANNVIRDPYQLADPVAAIHLLGVADAAVSGNRLWDCPGPGVLAEGSRTLKFTRNIFSNFYRSHRKLAQGVPDAVVGVIGCTDAQIFGNKIHGTDAANSVWVDRSTGTSVSVNKTARLTNASVALVGLGIG